MTSNKMKINTTAKLNKGKQTKTNRLMNKRAMTKKIYIDITLIITTDNK